jgi:O-antigen/teichoic acid export membrane protein
LLKRVLKDTVVYGIAGTASRFISVLLLPLYTRLFNPDQYGLLDLLVTTSAILVLLGGMEVGSGVGRSYFEAKDRGQGKTLVGTGLLLYVVSIPFWILLAGLSFHLWLNGYQGIMWAHILPMLISLLPTQILGYELLILRLERRPHYFAVFSIGDILTSAILNIIAVVFLGLGIPGVMWGLCISKLLWAAIGARLLFKHLHLKWDLGYAREILFYSVPTVPNVAVNWAQNYANRFVLIATLTMYQVGLFSLAVKLASGTALLINAFRTAWYPYSMEIIGKPGSAERYARMLDFYLVGMFSICALVGALGELAVKLLATNAYLSAGRLVGFIAMGLFWEGALQILMVGIDVTRKTYLGALGIFLGAVINLTTLYFTVHLWGTVAAGITFLVGSFSTAMICLALSQRQFRIPYRYGVLLIISALSLSLPFLFYLAPSPAETLTGIALNAGGKVLVTGVLCVLVASIVISAQERESIVRECRAVFWTLVSRSGLAWSRG